MCLCVCFLVRYYYVECTDFTYDSIKILDKDIRYKEISNIFNKYVANIGTKLASSINCCDQTQTFKSYLKSPTEKAFSFSKVCEPEVQQIINQMKKKSRGVDEISSQLLKVIGKEICKSLTLIIN